jgi:hypothetical protein
MYTVERKIPSEEYYKKLLTIYSKYILKLVVGRYKGALIYIDTDSRMVYDTRGQAVMQFRH